MNFYTLGQEQQPRDITMHGHNQVGLAIQLKELLKHYRNEPSVNNPTAVTKFKIMKFTTMSGTTLDFPSVDFLRQLCGQKIKRFCVIQQFSQPHTFYLIITFFNVAVRKHLTEICKNIIRTFISPFSQTNNIRIETFNNGHQNLHQVYIWLNQIIQNDDTYIKIDCNQATAEDDLENAKIKAQAQINIELNQLKGIFEKYYVLQFRSLVTFGSQQKGTFMEDLSKMSDVQFNEHCMNSLPKMSLMKVQNLAYDLALTCSELTSTSHYQKHKGVLFEPQTKQELIRNIMSSNPNLHSAFQLCYYGRHDELQTKIIHPHPLTAFVANQKNYFGRGVVELMAYHEEYLKNILLICTWMNNVIFKKPEDVGRQHSVLCLYGASGSGKSTINNTLKDAFNGYLWIMQGEFQSPDVGYTSLIVVEDTTIEKLDNEKMKQITDYQSTCKLQYKQAHPVDISYRCPVVVSSNDDIVDRLQNIKGDESKKASRLAVGHRLFPVKFETSFSDVYTPPVLEEDTGLIERIKEMNKPNKIALFNTLIGLSLILNNNMSELQAPSVLYAYFNDCVTQVLNTFFGRMIYTHINGGLVTPTLDSKIDNEIKDINRLHYTDNKELQQEIRKQKQKFFTVGLGKFVEESIFQHCHELYYNEAERPHITELMIMHQCEGFLSLESLTSLEQGSPLDIGVPNPILRRNVYRFNVLQPCMSLRSWPLKEWYTKSEIQNIFEKNMQNEVASQDLPSVSGEYISPDKVPSTAKKPKADIEEEKVPIIQLGKRKRSLDDGTAQKHFATYEPHSVFRKEDLTEAEKEELHASIYGKTSKKLTMAAGENSSDEEPDLYHHSIADGTQQILGLDEGDSPIQGQGHGSGCNDSLNDDYEEENDF